MSPPGSGGTAAHTENAWRLLKQCCSPALGLLLPCSQTQGTRRPGAPKAPEGSPTTGPARASHPPGEIRALHNPQGHCLGYLSLAACREWEKRQRRRGRKEEITVGFTHTRALTGPVFHLGLTRPWAPWASSPALPEGTRPSSPEFQNITHLPHELAFPVHTQVEFCLLPLDPDLTTEGVCLH